MLDNVPPPFELDAEIIKSFCSCASIPKYSSILDFFEAGFNLTDDDRFKKFEIRYAPWIRELCKWFDDIKTDWIYLIMGSQISKTTFMMGVFLFVSQFIQGDGNIPCLWVQSVQEEAELFVSERLKAFLDESGKDAIKKDTWKKQAFQVNNAKLKVGYATNKTSLRSKPARFIFGDECGIWKTNISYVKKRARTFKGKNRCGIFGTTPPDDPSHHSAQEMRTGNFYQWYVDCPDCKEAQPLKFTQLKWQGKIDDGVWDYEKVKETTHYQCMFCESKWKEEQKLDIINTGKFVCVDSETYERKKETPSDSKTAHVSALYSIMMPWADLACEFLTAKAGGVEALKSFLTDELAEVPDNQIHFSLKTKDIAEHVDLTRKIGEIGEGYALYTAGVDLQRTGKAFITVTAFKNEGRVSAHVIDYSCVKWRDDKGNYYFDEIEEFLQRYEKVLHGTCYDATDGIIQQRIYDYCLMAGPRHIPLLDLGTQKDKLLVRVAQDLPRYKQNLYKKHKYQGLKIFSINSDLFKDEYAYAIKQEPGTKGAWTFPRDVSNMYLNHFANEIRKRNRNGKTTWTARYKGAPQHFFSSFIYSLSLMEDVRHVLMRDIRKGVQQNKVRYAKKRGMRSKGRTF